MKLPVGTLWNRENKRGLLVSAIKTNLSQEQPWDKFYIRPAKFLEQNMNIFRCNLSSQIE